MMVYKAGPFFLLVVVSQALEITPPENQWVKPDQQNVTLICKTTEKVRSCSWTTPYGKSYPLQAGLVAEAGRLAHYVEDKDKEFECGILITQFEARDSGRWKCNVGVVDSGEVSTATGIGNITVATAPKSVMLDEPFNNEYANLTTGDTYEVKCIATEARPAPVFKWMMDDMPLEGKTMDAEVFVGTSGISTFAQTLFYKPEYLHANKTLKCIIDHVALSKQDSIGVTILLEEEEPTTGSSTESLGAGPTAGIIIAVVIIIGVVSILVFLVGRARRANQTEEKTDEEQGIAGEEEADKTSQTESAHGEAEKKKEDDEEVAPKKLKDRVNEFVAKFKKTSEKKEEVVEEVEVKDVKDEEKMEEIEPEDKEEKKE